MLSTEQARHSLRQLESDQALESVMMTRPRGMTPVFINSLSELSLLSTPDSHSILGLHLGYLQQWLAHTLEDEVLAAEVAKIDASEQTYADKLRACHEVVKAHLLACVAQCDSVS